VVAVLLLFVIQSLVNFQDNKIKGVLINGF